ncbi:hypothetical protein I4U23_013508 [Adineta vaga]|nr:hypothetical protein I4U23_013508 [Adineta vaga]
MGNIVTPDQGLLPLPSYTGVTTPYPWWLNAALAIWALLALLCCWLLLLLYLLRYCCKWWRHRQYATDRMSLRKRVFGFGNANGRQGAYVMREHFATAPLPPVPYAVSDGIYGGAMPYVTSGMINTFDPSTEGVVENVETNIHRNITKNYYINEEQNYFMQSDPKVQSIERTHDPEVQRLPAPTVTTINMAAERITDNPNWENVNAKEDLNDQKLKQAAAEIVKNDPSISKQEVKYEKPPDILTHEPPPTDKNRKLGGNGSDDSDDDSTTSEMSGHDSESIYETIRVFTPKKEILLPIDDEDEDDYKTAGIDEVEFEVKDLIRLQKASARNSDPYDDILTSTYLPRHLLTSHSPSISSSSTLNNLMPIESHHDPTHAGSGEEETVTQTVQTQQVQTTVRQIGQNLGNSAFFVPLSSALPHHDEQSNDNEKIIVPVSTSSIHHDEKPAIQHF